MPVQRKLKRRERTGSTYLLENSFSLGLDSLHFTMHVIQRKSGHTKKIRCNLYADVRVLV